MLLSTLPTIEGRTIIECRGAVFGAAGVTFSINADKKFQNCNELAINRMINLAKRMGGNAIIDVSIKFRQRKTCILIIASGTAVVVG